MQTTPLVLALLIFSGTLCVVGCGSPGSALPPPLPPTSAASQQADPSLVLTGHFHHVGGESDLAARDAAIDRVTSELSSFIRDRAKERLTERSPIIEELLITQRDDLVSIDFDGRVTLSAPLGGAPVEVTPPQGDQTVQLSYQMHGTSLVQTMQGPKGGVRRLYAPRAGGELVVEVTLYAEQLPSDVVYELHYATRSGPLPGAANVDDVHDVPPSTPLP